MMKGIMAQDTFAGPAPAASRPRRKFFWKPRPTPQGYWKRNFPFFLLHVSALTAVFTGLSWPVIAFALITFWARVFFVTGFYHRYFSHRSFKTSRAFQFLMGFGGPDITAITIRTQTVRRTSTRRVRAASGGPISVG